MRPAYGIEILALKFRGGVHKPNVIAHDIVGFLTPDLIAAIIASHQHDPPGVIIRIEPAMPEIVVSTRLRNTVNHPHAAQLAARGIPADMATGQNHLISRKTLSKLCGPTANTTCPASLVGDNSAGGGDEINRR